MIEESNIEINGRVEETNLDLVNLTSSNYSQCNEDYYAIILKSVFLFYSIDKMCYNHSTMCLLTFVIHFP